MTVWQYIHFSIEMWGALFCVVATISVFITRRFDKVRANKLTNLLVASTLLMVSDAFAWMFRGNPTSTGYYAVRIANFCAFFFGFLVMPLVAEYISYLIYRRSGTSGLYWKYIEWALFFIGAALLVANVFKPFIYTFDERNTYYRLAFGFIPGAIAFLGLITTLGVAIEYLKYLYKYEKAAVITFLLLPLIAVVAQIFHYGVSFANLALVVSSLILFISYNA